MNLVTHHTTIVHHDEVWMKPHQPSYLKVNVDAAIDQSRHKMGFGFIVRNKDDLFFVAAKNFVQKGVYNPKVAEAVGIKEALKWVKSLGFDYIHVEVDALEIVKDVHASSSSSFSKTSIILDDIRETFREFTHVIFSFTR